MGEAPIEALQDAIRHLHGCGSTFVSAEPVHETFNGETVWEGKVSVFDLDGHADASRAYAWSYETENGRRRFFAVLHIGAVDSPTRAVQAAIINSKNA